MVVVFISFLSILVSVMFFTLLERKYLACSQERMGPKRFFQALLDGVKLFSKGVGVFWSVVVYVSSMFSVMITLLLWFSILNFHDSNIVFMMVLVILQMSSFIWMLVTVYSSSKFCVLSSLRVMAQKVSCEVLISSLFFMFCLSSGKLYDYDMDKIIVVMLYILWFFCCLIEVGRAPFDFEESESEFVSGYNTDLSGFNFSLFYVSEYSNIMFFSLVSGVFSTVFMLPFYLFYFLFSRCVMPRWRYDKQMSFCWVVLLPVVLLWMIFIVLVS